MANVLTPWFKKLIPAPILKVLTIVTNILVKGREISGGAYSKTNNPFGDGGQSGPK